MYMYEKYDYSLFESRFRDYDRLDNFPTGLRKLYNYLTNLAKNYGEPIELDVIALCCEWTESSIIDVLYDNGIRTIEELEQETLVIPVDSTTIIYYNF